MEFYDVVSIERNFTGLTAGEVEKLLGAYGDSERSQSIGLSSVVEDIDGEDPSLRTFTVALKATKWVFSGDGPEKTLTEAKRELYELLEKIEAKLS